MIRDVLPGVYFYTGDTLRLPVLTLISLREQVDQKQTPWCK